jgi:hypothetical protein
VLFLHQRDRGRVRRRDAIAALDAAAAPTAFFTISSSARCCARYFSMAMPHDGHCQSGALSASLRT